MGTSSKTFFCGCSIESENLVVKACNHSHLDQVIGMAPYSILDTFEMSLKLCWPTPDCLTLLNAISLAESNHDPQQILMFLQTRFVTSICLSKVMGKQGLETFFLNVYAYTCEICDLLIAR